MKKNSNTKNQDKIEVLRNLIEEPKVVMLSTRLDKIPTSVCPMIIQEIDEQGDIWFFSSKKTTHFEDIESDNRVQIMYIDNINKTYISIYGHASHIVDAQKIETLWNPAMNAWFNGKDDSNLVLLNLNIQNAHYWNTEENKLISFF